MNNNENAFVSRWGDAELDDHQYASIPGWILRHYCSLWGFCFLEVL